MSTKTIYWRTAAPLSISRIDTKFPSFDFYSATSTGLRKYTLDLIELTVKAKALLSFISWRLLAISRGLPLAFDRGRHLYGGTFTIVKTFQPPPSLHGDLLISDCKLKPLVCRYLQMNSRYSFCLVHKNRIRDLFLD